MQKKKRKKIQRKNFNQTKWKYFSKHERYQTWKRAWPLLSGDKMYCKLSCLCVCSKNPTDLREYSFWMHENFLQFDAFNWKGLELSSGNRDLVLCPVDILVVIRNFHEISFLLYKFEPHATLILLENVEKHLGWRSTDGQFEEERKKNHFSH